MTSSPTTGHGPWGESWNESQPSRVPMVQIWMLSDEWLVRYNPLKLFNLKLWRNSTNRMKLWTDEWTNKGTERRKLYTPQHKCRGIKTIVRQSNSCGMNGEMIIEVRKDTSPFGLIDLQLQDMETNSETSIINIEPEFSFLEGLCPSKSKPEYWNRLGSSKSRSVAQQEEAKVTVQSLVENCNYNELVAFTDGSCLGNPGPYGSGACIFVPNQTEPVRLKRPVTNWGSILFGE